VRLERSSEHEARRFFEELLSGGDHCVVCRAPLRMPVGAGGASEVCRVGRGIQSQPDTPVSVGAGRFLGVFVF
jgi:hypothetical protein